MKAPGGFRFNLFYSNNLPYQLSGRELLALAVRL
jgi:hypothetical protein